MPELPLVTIVTPSYNQSAYLEQTMRSVLEQDYPNIEYLVVDGGSTDSSVEIIQRYADKLAWWVSEKDSGQADGINKGLRRARGEVVAWLNSDDCYLPGAIRQAVEALQANPQAGMVYADVYAIDETGKQTNRMRYQQWGLKDLLSFRIIGQPGVFMRRSVLGQAGYLDQSYQYLLDHQLWVRIASLAPMVYVNTAWAEARYHAAAKNTSQASHFGEEAFRILEWAQSNPETSKVMQQHQRTVWAGAQRFNARYLLDAGMEKDAWGGYVKALRLDWREVLPEWHRMLYIPLSRIGFGKIKEIYLRWRTRQLQRRGTINKENRT